MDLPTYKNAGGGINGLRAFGSSVGNKVNAKLSSMVGRRLTDMQAQGVAVCGFALIFAFIFFTGGARSQAIEEPYDDSDDNVEPDVSEEYKAGWEDCQSENDFGKNMPKPRSRTSYSLPSSSGGDFGGGGGFGMGSVFTMAILGKQVFELGGGRQWNTNTFMMNIQSMPLWRQALLGMLALRMFGLSPI
jgi:hypothetical protein